MIVSIPLAAALLLAPDAVPAPAATPTPAAAAAQQAPAARYCVAGTITGSRLERRTCLTRAEWLGRGFDPLDPQE